MLFFKRLSDVYDEERAQIESEYGAGIDFAEFHRFQIPEGCHWRDVRARTTNVGQAGVVSFYDSTEYFRRRAEDIMLVEDIESSVKELIRAAFIGADGDVIPEKLAQAMAEVTDARQSSLKRYREALNKYLKIAGLSSEITETALEESFRVLEPKVKTKAFEDLTLYEYSTLLLNKDRWSFYQPILQVKTEELRKLLDEVRETRNILAHFRGELTSTQRDQLKFCADWLARCGESLSAFHSAIPVNGSLATTVINETIPVYGEKTPSVDAGVSKMSFPGDELIPAEESLSPEASRYAPLAIWLNSRPGNQDRVVMTFQEVEAIIGGALPSSAREHRSWWANDSVEHVQSQQWLEVGWRVAQLSLSEETLNFVRIKEREKAYIAFFSKLLKELELQSGFPLRATSPSGQCWLTVAGLSTGPQLVYFLFSFALNRRFRIELYIDTNDQVQNKAIFDLLQNDQETFERAMDSSLSWERLPGKRASRIALYHAGAITDDEKALTQLLQWAVLTMPRFYNILAEPALKALKKVQSGDATG